MNCTDAWREALTRHLSSRAPSAPAPGQRQAAEAGREGVAGRPLRRRSDPGQDDLESPGATAVSESGPAMALDEDATAVNVEGID